jgi:hypothetical protein
MGKDTTKAASYLLVMAILFYCCQPKATKPKPNIAFYFWQTSFKISPFEKKCLDSLATKNLYIKFYDVVWNPTLQSPQPIALIKANTFDTLLYKNNNCKFTIIPTVFITNEALFYLPADSVQGLANKIYTATINTIATNSFNNIAEYQFDCDWSAATKEKYFALLQHLKKLYGQAPVSATIRMHQIKFSNKTGIPPVDKGLLMCYNMGNLKALATQNSIFEISEFKKYSQNLKNYALPLDVAYPIFSWHVWFKNNQFYKLVNELPMITQSNSAFTKNKQFFTCVKDTAINGLNFTIGDVLRHETIAANDLHSLSQQLSGQLKNAPQNIIFYHLDSVHLTKFYPNDLQNICAPFYN